MNDRWMLGLIVALSAVGCGGRIAVDPDAGDASAADATNDPDATDARGDASGDASDDALNGGRGPAPVPTCTGTTQCLQDDAGLATGGALIKCDPVEFVGPWNLLLQRSINGQFQTVQAKAVQTPGFGTEFQDTTVRPVRLTYRVCVVDDQGTRCAAPFTTDPPPNCACEPFTCDFVLACNTSLDDGCGSIRQCGPCTNGTMCNARTHSCCPPGFESNGHEGCECAPPKPCPGRLYWDTVACECQVFQF